MTDCTHRWVLETPNGEFAQGYCKHCRIVRGDFKNAGTDNSFRDRAALESAERVVYPMREQKGLG